MKALLRWQTTLSKHMQALEEPELPENFFQLSVGAPREGKSFFQREQAFLGFLLFLQVHE